MFEIYSGPPKVFPIGITQPIAQGFDDFFHERDVMWGRDQELTPESIAVCAGSVCYDSFHNPAHRSDHDYLQQQIVGHNHQSVIEHITINFAVTHLPRSTQLELVRHRVGVAYSFRSQRFTDSWLEFIVPPLFRGQPEEEDFRHHAEETYELYRNLCDTISREPLGDVEGTLRRKRVKEAARAILTNSVGSDGVVTMNARALRHIVKMRSDEHAEAGIREFAYAVYEAAEPLLPAILADAEEVPVSFGAPMIRFGG